MGLSTRNVLAGNGHGAATGDVTLLTRTGRNALLLCGATLRSLGYGRQGERSDSRPSVRRPNNSHSSAQLTPLQRARSL